MDTTTRRLSRRLTLGVGCLLAWLVVSDQQTATVAGAAAQRDAALVQQGREVLGQVCTGCHGNIAQILRGEAGRSAERWRTTVYSMISRGAHILPDEIDALVAYLEDSYGPSSVASLTSAAGSAGALPDAAGKAILERSCSLCHDVATATRNSAGEDWDAVLSRMVTYGANISAADRQTLITYLSGLGPSP